MKIAFEVTTRKINGKEYTEIFADEDMAIGYGKYKASRPEYTAYEVKEVVV